MRDFCARLKPWGWVVLVVVALIVVDVALPYLFAAALWAVVLWALVYFIAFLSYIFGWE